MPTTAATIYTAKLKFDPTEPGSKNGYEPQHSTVLMFADGEEQRVYFAPGILSQLQKGDAILAEWSKGKWRIYERNQPPELRALLHARGTADTDDDSPAPTPQTITPNPTGVSDFSDVHEMATIALELSQLLPDWDYEALGAMAQSVFKYRRG